jgi:hypothetical protein
MDGLKWDSYIANNTINASSNNFNDLYRNVVNFFNTPPSTLKSGSLTKLRTSNFMSDVNTPPVTTFNNNVSQYNENTAVKFYGYFCPPTTGVWMFDLGVTSYLSDDLGALFIGPPDTNIVPSNTYSLSTSTSTKNPIIYNTYQTGSRTGSLTLTAGIYYPLLIYFSQTGGGYVWSLSFSSPSYNSGNLITDYTGIIYQAVYPCFKEGTKILTDKGYIEIQDLRKGDLIKTLNDDFKPIFMIGKRTIHHTASNDGNKNQLYKCCQEKYPEIFEDLVITGHHSVLVDNFTSEEQQENVKEILGAIYVTSGKYRLPACLDERASVYETEGNYTIYHFALEHENYYCNYGVYANGLLVETCSKRYLKELSNMILIE